MFYPLDIYQQLKGKIMNTIKDKWFYVVPRKTAEPFDTFLVKLNLDELSDEMQGYVDIFPRYRCSDDIEDIPENEDFDDAEILSMSKDWEGNISLRSQEWVLDKSNLYRLQMYAEAASYFCDMAMLLAEQRYSIDATGAALNCGDGMMPQPELDYYPWIAK